MSEPKKRGRPRKSDSCAEQQKVPDNMKIKNGTKVSDQAIAQSVKKKQVRPKRSELLKPHYAPGQMSQMIVHAVTLQKMGKVDMSNPDAVNERVNDYLSYCIEHDMKPTVESMALAFGTNRMQLWRWREGVECNIPKESREAIKRGYDLMNEILTQSLVDGAINPISAFFLLKNSHGYKDQTDVVVSAQNPYSDASATDVRGKYLEGIPGQVTGEGNVE